MKQTKESNYLIAAYSMFLFVVIISALAIESCGNKASKEIVSDKDSVVFDSVKVDSLK